MVQRYSDAMDQATPATREQIERLRDVFDTCFGCGATNKVGLGLSTFTAADNGATGPFSVGDDYTGFHGVVHGGVIATALDEISAWAAILSEGVFVLTAKLDIRYRREARPREAYTLTGTVSLRQGKRLSIESELTAPEGVIAQSSGLFIVAGSVVSVLADHDARHV